MFNQRVLCKPGGGGGGGGANKFVTEIRLHHVLYTGLANQIHAPSVDEAPSLDNDDGQSESVPSSVPPTTESPVAPLDAKRIIECVQIMQIGVRSRML